MYSIWGKKSKEAEAEKKKPRTTAAQIRVQKGFFLLQVYYLMTYALLK
jgi:ubiquitin-conjugating enzyme E2 M